MSESLRRALICGVLPVLVIADQISKYLILNTKSLAALGCLDGRMACGKIELSSLLDLTMVWNRGMSFGALQSEGLMRWALVALTVSIAIVFTVWLFRAERRLTGWALCLIVAGAVGNVIDRVRFGAVVDFLDFSGPWFGMTVGGFDVGFPWIFNVADACITVGAALLFLDQFLLSRDAPKQANTNA